MLLVITLIIVIAIALTVTLLLNKFFKRRPIKYLPMVVYSLGISYCIQTMNGSLEVFSNQVKFVILALLFVMFTTNFIIAICIDSRGFGSFVRRTWNFSKDEAKKQHEKRKNTKK